MKERILRGFVFCEIVFLYSCFNDRVICIVVLFLECIDV